MYIRHLITGDIYLEEFGNLNDKSKEAVRAIAKSCLDIIDESTKDEVNAFNEYVQTFEEFDQNGLTRSGWLEQCTSQEIELSRADRKGEKRFLTGPNNATQFVFYMTLAIRQRRLWRRFLRRRYHFDTERQKHVRRQKKRLDPYELDCLGYANRKFCFYNTLFLQGAMGALILVGKGKSVAANIAEALSPMRQLYSEYFFLQAAEAVRSSDPPAEEKGIFQIAAILRSQTKIYPRLRQALEGMTHSEFAARTFLAWNEYWMNENTDNLIDPTSIVKYCRKHIARQVYAELELSDEQQTSLESIGELGVEDFFARESARIDFESLSNKAGLAPREAELLELMRLDDNATSAKLGAKLGIDAGTVRAMNSRIKKKFKIASGQ